LSDCGIDYEPDEEDDVPISFVDELDAELKFKTS
jgi:hypothetical protein